MTSQDNSAELVRLTDSVFGQKSLIIDAALETSIYHSDNSDVYCQFKVISFLNRKIVWINPVQKEKGILYAQRARVDCPNGEWSDGFGYLMKFLSALCYLSDGPILDVVFNVAGPFPGPRCLHETHITCLNGTEIDILLSSIDWHKLTENNWAEMAFYRQAVNSRSPYLAVLSFWKVIESQFGYDSAKMKKFVNTELDQSTGFGEWKRQSHKDFFRRLIEARVKAAHAFFGKQSKQLQNPDSPGEYLEMQNNKAVIRYLSAKAIQLQLEKYK